jgi:hypothetical protein
MTTNRALFRTVFLAAVSLFGATAPAWAEVHHSPYSPVGNRHPASAPFRAALATPKGPVGSVYRQAPPPAARAAAPAAAAPARVATATATAARTTAAGPAIHGPKKGK